MRILLKRWNRFYHYYLTLPKQWVKSDTYFNCTIYIDPHSFDKVKNRRDNLDIESIEKGQIHQFAAIGCRPRVFATFREILHKCFLTKPDWKNCQLCCEKSFQFCCYPDGMRQDKMIAYLFILLCSKGMNKLKQLMFTLIFTRITSEQLIWMSFSLKLSISFAIQGISIRDDWKTSFLCPSENPQLYQVLLASPNLSGWQLISHHFAHWKIVKFTRKAVGEANSPVAAENRPSGVVSTNHGCLREKSWKRCLGWNYRLEEEAISGRGRERESDSECLKPLRWIWKKWAGSKVSLVLAL